MVTKIAFPPLPLEQFKGLELQAQESAWKVLCDSVSAKRTTWGRVDRLCIANVPGNKALRIMAVKQAGQLVVLFIGRLKDSEAKEFAHDVELLTKVEGLDPIEVSINPKEFASFGKLAEVMDALERRSNREQMCSRLSPAHQLGGYQIMQGRRNSAVRHLVDYAKVTETHWNVRTARAKIGDLLDKAAEEPQIVHRKDRRYVISAEDLHSPTDELPTAAQDLEFFFSRRARGMVPEFSEGSMPDPPLLS